MVRRLASLLVALAVTVPVAIATQPAVAGIGGGPGHYQEFGDAGGFMNILPPGQDGSFNGAEAAAFESNGTYPPHTTDQRAMYADLVHAVPGLTEAQLTDFYKDGSFGVPADQIERTYSPCPAIGGTCAPADVTVIRDSGFGVPHIFGQTRYATMFAMGYTGAEDRLFFMDILRHAGRARLSEFIGPSESNLQMDREVLRDAPYVEQDYTDQVQEGRSRGTEGEAIYQDAVAYVDGVNRYIQEAILDSTKLPAEYPALQVLPQNWKLEDLVATAALIGSIFGKGGGRELQNLCGLQTMAETAGSVSQARRVFRDLHFANEPTAPTTSTQTAPYMTNLGPHDAAAHPAIGSMDCAGLAYQSDGWAGPPATPGTSASTGTLRSVDGPLGRVSFDFPDAMSNALLVTGAHTQSGHPIAVFGPQVAYFMPQILVEKDVHGPGIDARGAAFPGVDLYAELGRGRDFAFSATSAGADNTDQFVLKLCEPGGGTPTTASLGYQHDGACVPIERFDHQQTVKPTAGGVGTPAVLDWYVERTPDYGPIVARGTLTAGTPIAIASLRATYGSELGSARGFYRLNDPGFMSNGYESFRRAIKGIDYTFNWLYVDAADAGYQLSCRCPQRAQGVDPYLPSWGTGEWDWHGRVPRDGLPHDLNPARGYLVSWNNKPAKGFKSHDGQFAYGPVFRSQALSKRLKAMIDAGPLDRAGVVSAMEDGGTVDLRGMRDMPWLIKVMGSTAPGGLDPRVQDMWDRLRAWKAAASHRRDLDDSGTYDDPQSPAIMDAWWPRLAHAMFDTSGYGAIDALGLQLHDPPQAHLGSAFDDSFYGQVNKDLRSALGRPLRGRWSQTYCGGGDLAACRADLWSSLEQAAADLEAEFTSPNVADWQRTIGDDQVEFRAVGIVTVPPFEWINRPTWQQVVEVGASIP